MALHFYTHSKAGFAERATGSGTPSKTADWTATLESGKVERGTTYFVTRGTEQPSSASDRYNCKTGAEKNHTATFGPKVTLREEEEEQEESSADAQGEPVGNLLVVATLQAALAATTKMVKIEIAEADLRQLKQNGYRLCFAKKIAQGDYNVVWQSYTQFLPNNRFSWVPMYQVFGTNVFKENITVEATTNFLEMGLGETTLLDADGLFEPASTGGPKNSLNVNNEFGPINLGVNQLSTGIDGSQVSTPIYVAPKKMVSGQAELTPVESVMVWFEQDIETSSMFSTARSKSVEINLTGRDSAVRRYEKERWITP